VVLAVYSRVNAQSPPQSTIPPAPTMTPFDPTNIFRAFTESGNYTNWATPAITTLGIDDADHEKRLRAAESAIAALPAPIVPPQNEILLVVPYSGPVGWPGMTTAVTEFQLLPRTRTQIDFTNVHQVRLCQNVSTTLAGAAINLDTSADQVTWTPLIANFSVGTKGISCTPWTPLASPIGDATVRISGANTGAAGTPSWWKIALELR
jgi:hypothetical protein